MKSRRSPSSKQVPIIDHMVASVYNRSHGYILMYGFGYTKETQNTIKVVQNKKWSLIDYGHG